MRRTFAARWKSFINCGEPPTLQQYITTYPVLKETSYVSILYLQMLHNQKVNFISLTLARFHMGGGVALGSPLLLENV